MKKRTAFCVDSRAGGEKTVTNKIISLGKGKSAAASAYREGEKITNKFDGMIHDYTHKDGVVHTEVLLSDHAPAVFQTGRFCGTK